MMIIFKIMFSLLKHCNNEQESLIMRFVTNFSENHLSQIKCNKILLRLFSVIRERYELK